MSMVRVVPVFLLAAACANAGGSSPPVDSRSADAPRLIDAPVALDAPKLVDAPVSVDAPVMVDAPSGPFCSSNSECTTSGECCFKVDSQSPGFCVPGTVIVNTCIPIS